MTAAEQLAAELREAVRNQAHSRTRELVDRYSAAMRETLATLPPADALQAAGSATALLEWALLATRCALAHDSAELARLTRIPRYGRLPENGRSGSVNLHG